MPATRVSGANIGDGLVQRVDVDAATAGQALIRKVIAGTNVTITSTGPDAGTGDVTINAAAGGAAGGAKGTTTVNFGAFPGATDVTVVVTGQTAIVAGSVVRAFLRPIDTADHTADEHMLEQLSLYAANIVAGTGFTIYAFATGRERLYGSYTIAWVWS